MANPCDDADRSPIPLDQGQRQDADGALTHFMLQTAKIVDDPVTVNGFTHTTGIVQRDDEFGHPFVPVQYEDFPATSDGIATVRMYPTGLNPDALDPAVSVVIRMAPAAANIGWVERYRVASVDLPVVGIISISNADNIHRFVDSGGDIWQRDFNTGQIFEHSGTRHSLGANDNVYVSGNEYLQVSDRFLSGSHRITIRRIIVDNAGASTNLEIIAFDTGETYSARVNGGIVRSRLVSDRFFVSFQGRRSASSIRDRFILQWDNSTDTMTLLHQESGLESFLTGSFFVRASVPLDGLGATGSTVTDRPTRQTSASSLYNYQISRGGAYVGTTTQNITTEPIRPLVGIKDDLLVVAQPVGTQLIYGQTDDIVTPAFSTSTPFPKQGLGDGRHLQTFGATESFRDISRVPGDESSTEAWLLVRDTGTDETVVYEFLGPDPTTDP